MALWVDRQAAPAAVWAAGGDDPIGVFAERRGLAASDVQANVTVVALLSLAVFVDRGDLFQLDHEAIGGSVVPEPDRAEHEHLLDRLDQLERGGNPLVVGGGGGGGAPGRGLWRRGPP